MKTSILCAMTITIASLFIYSFGGTHEMSDGSQWMPPDKGTIPDAQTAIKVVEAVLGPIEGEERVAAERPFKAELKGDTWSVTGTLRHNLPPGTFVFGGTTVVEISKSRGCIIRINQSK
jgi:hypothetical protein